MQGARVVAALQTRPTLGLGLTAGLSTLVVCVLVGSHVLLHLGSSVVGANPASDYQVMTWSLAWWPWAVDHGVNPLHAHLLWPPGGFSTLWMTTIPVPALLALPITLTAGPLVAYNVLILLAVPLASAAAFLLCWELTERLLPSFVGGLVFALSPYMLGHTLSQHLDLTFVFPVPLLALLVVRYLHGRTSAKRFVIGFTALLLVQVGVSFELFLDVTLFVALGIAIALVRLRRGAVRVATLIGASYAACLPVLVPIAVLALGSSHAPLRYQPRNYATDLLNLVVPTTTSEAGNLHSAQTLAQHFVGNIGEQDAYLGLPLLVIALLSVRAHWRRGAWLIGALFAVALLLSLGPELTVNGRPVVGLPFSLSRLPLLQSLLPARLSLFFTLAAACLCALWLAHTSRAWLRILAAALLVASLLPNFSPPHRLLRAWAVSDLFGWSTDKVSDGFVSGQTWRRVIPPGSTVLVLPAGDRTAASYWQVRSGMHFALAAPATPFVPPGRAAAPIIRSFTNDQPPALAAARLRAFLLADRIGTVAVTRHASRWRGFAAAATESQPVEAGRMALYRVPRYLPPLRVETRPVGSTQVGEEALAAVRRRLSIKAWLRFDGSRAHVLAQLRRGGRPLAPPATLSAPGADADMPATAIDPRGDAAVVFTEWINARQLLRVATRYDGNWRVATLDETKQPIWSPAIVMTPGGTTLATWIDETDPTRTIRAAALPRGGRWSRATTVENGDGLGTVQLGVGDGNLVVLAWHDGIDTESRVRAELYEDGRWTRVVTLARTLALFDHVTIAGAEAAFVRWRLDSLTGAHRGLFAARRRGARWVVHRARS